LVGVGDLGEFVDFVEAVEPLLMVTGPFAAVCGPFAVVVVVVIVTVTTTRYTVLLMMI